MTAEDSPLLLLLRHGATDWSDELRFTSRTDLPLNARGVRQAERAAAAIAAAGLRVREVVTSPAQRARRTADIVAAGQPAPAPPLRVDEQLREVDFGPFEGMSAEQLAQSELGAAFQGWRDVDPPVVPAGAEPYELAADRAARVFTNVAARAGCTVIVGHGYLSRLMLARSVLGLPVSYLRRMRLDPGRFAAVVWEGEMPRLVALNTRELDAIRL